MHSYDRRIECEWDGIEVYLLIEVNKKELFNDLRKLIIIL